MCVHVYVMLYVCACAYVWNVQCVYICTRCMLDVEVEEQIGVCVLCAGEDVWVAHSQASYYS